MSNAPEKALAANLIRLLKEQQAREGVEARFYQEVKLPDGTCPDLVIHRTDIPDKTDFVAIYQVKMVLNETLLRQCIASQQWADMVVAAIPSEAMQSGLKMCNWYVKFQNQGVGLCIVGQHGITTHVQARVMPGHTEILRYLNQHNGEGGTFAAAGAKSDKRATKRNIKLAELEKAICDDGPVTLKNAAVILGYGTEHTRHAIIKGTFPTLRLVTGSGKTHVELTNEYFNPKESHPHA